MALPAMGSPPESAARVPVADVINAVRSRARPIMRDAFQSFCGLDVIDERGVRGTAAPMHAALGSIIRTRAGVFDTSVSPRCSFVLANHLSTRARRRNCDQGRRCVGATDTH